MDQIGSEMVDLVPDTDDISLLLAAIIERISDL